MQLAAAPVGEPAAFAALDLGTHNCRLLVAAPASDGFRVLDSFSRVVRLGEGLQSTGELGPDAMERAMDALQACADRLSRRRVRAVRAIATEACRQARNSQPFLDRVRAQTGLSVDVISTREEARLALESCAPLLAGPGRRALLFDVGGGSTELIWVRLEAGRAPELIGATSIPVGVVGLSEQFGERAFTPGGFAAMVEAVAERLQVFERTHRIGAELRRGGVRLLGTSGTVTTLAGEALALTRYRRARIDGCRLHADAAGRAVSALRGMTREQLALHPCVGQERVDFVLPGCAIYAAIHAQWPMDEVVVADRGLREGMLLRLIRQAGVTQ